MDPKPERRQSYKHRTGRYENKLLLPTILSKNQRKAVGTPEYKMKSLLTEENYQVGT